MWRRPCGCMLVALIAVSQHALGQAENPRVRGSRVTVEMVSNRNAVLRGELIAVSADSIWLLNGSGLRAAPLGFVKGASLKRHNMNGQVGLVWTLVGGLVTGGLLTGACATVSEGCGGVLAGTMLVWGVVGGVSAISMGISSRRSFSMPNIGEKLRGYARFPQGLPTGLDRNAMGLRVAVRASVPPTF